MQTTARRTLCAPCAIALATLAATALAGGPPPALVQYLPWEPGSKPIYRNTTGSIINAPIPVADFDLDGQPDLAYQRQRDAENGFDNNNILIRTASGNGGLITLAEIPCNTNQNGLIVTDLNNDARPDLISYTCIFLNTTEGWITLDHLPEDAPAFDRIYGPFHLNNDHYPDFKLVVLGDDDYYLLGGPTTPYTIIPEAPAPPIDTPAPIESASTFPTLDLDADGLSDSLIFLTLTDGTSLRAIAFRDATDSTILVEPAILLQSDDNIFTRTIRSLTPGFDDILLLGIYDALLGISDASYYSIDYPFPRDQVPTPEPIQSTLPLPIDLAADLDNDGELDLVSSLAEEIRPNVFFIRGTGLITYSTFDQPTTPGDRTPGTNTFGGVRETLYDANSDGILDYVNTAAIAFGVRTPDGRQRFAQIPFSIKDQLIDSTLETADRAIAAIDLDLDGDLDLVTRFSLLNPGHLDAGEWFFGIQTDISPDAYSIVQARHPDYPNPLLIESESFPNEEPFYFYELGNPFSAIRIPVIDDVTNVRANGLNELEAIDLDDDGFQEILTLSFTDLTRFLAVWTPANDTYTLAQTLPLDTVDQSGLATGDFNHDGFTDVAVAGAFQLTLFLNDGTGDLTPDPAGPRPLPFHALWLTTTDANNDGLDDLIAARNTQTGSADLALWLQGDTDPVVILDDPIRTAAEVYPGEFNGDQWIDLFVIGNGTPPFILAGPLSSGNAEVYPVPTSAEPSDIDPLYPPQGELADITGDGLPDLIYRQWGEFVVVPTHPITANTCPPDLNNDGFLDVADISTFIDLFLAADPAADLNEDGFLDLGDLRAFVDFFLTGC